MHPFSYYSLKIHSQVHPMAPSPVSLPSLSLMFPSPLAHSHHDAHILYIILLMEPSHDASPPPRAGHFSNPWHLPFLHLHSLSHPHSVGVCPRHSTKEALVKDSTDLFFGKSSCQFPVLIWLDQQAALNSWPLPSFWNVCFTRLPIHHSLVISYLTALAHSSTLVCSFLGGWGVGNCGSIASQCSQWRGSIPYREFKKSNETDWKSAGLIINFYHSLAILNNISDKIPLSAGMDCS